MDEHPNRSNGRGQFSAVRQTEPGSDEAAVYDWSDEPSLTLAVVEAVTDTLGVDVDEIEELNAAVDADALEDLFGDGRSPRRLFFEFADCEVTLTPSLITVYPPQ